MSCTVMDSVSVEFIGFPLILCTFPVGSCKLSVASLGLCRFSLGSLPKAFCKFSYVVRMLSIELLRLMLPLRAGHKNS